MYSLLLIFFNPHYVTEFIKKLIILYYFNKYIYTIPSNYTKYIYHLLKFVSLFFYSHSLRFIERARYIVLKRDS